MPKEKDTALGGRKSEPLKDDDILDFAEEILGTADEEILKLEDTDEAGEEEEDIIDLTEVAGYEAGDEDEEEILDLTDELEDVADDEILELGETAATSEDDAAASNADNDAPPADSSDDEDILELDEVVAEGEQGGFEIEEDMFDLDDVEAEADSETGSVASSFTIEADTIELSEADRRSLEEEFSFEPETGPAKEEVSNSADRQKETIVADHEPEVELVSVMPDENDDPWNAAEHQPETSAHEAENDEETEEIVLDFGESGEEAAAAGETIPGAFDRHEETLSAESRPPVESVLHESQTASENLESIPQVEAAKPDGFAAQEFMDSAEKAIEEFSEQDRDQEGYAVEETGSAASKEPHEITIEDDGTDAEDAFTWTDHIESDATDPSPSWTAQTDESNALEEKAAAESVDAPLSTDAIFADDETMDEDGSDYAVSPTFGDEELPEEGGLGVNFGHSEAFEEQDMHRVADPISVRVKEPAARSDDHANEDDLLNRVFDNESPAISTERLESIVEETVNRIFAEKIETILVDAIERAVTREIERLKQLVLGGED